MKKRLWLILLALGCLLLSGCGSLPAQGPLGTVETATQAALQDSTIYFRYPVGPVNAPTGIAAYHLDTEELTQLPGIPETNVLGLQATADSLYYLTDTGLYRCGLDGSAHTLLADTSENGTFRNAWFFLLEDTVYLCRTDFGVSEHEGIITQIARLDADGQVAPIYETSSFYPTLDSCVCYRDGMLYYQDLKADEIRKVDLSDGSAEPVSAWTNYLFATSEGVLFGDESLNAMSDGTTVCAECSGWFIGCNGSDPYFLGSAYSTYGTICVIRDGEAEVLLPDFPWDMIAAEYIPAYQAGPYTLFYSPKDLIGDIEDPPEMVHYLYLLDGTEVKRIGFYVQDFPYV